jgi:hypothetical protein
LERHTPLKTLEATSLLRFLHIHAYFTVTIPEDELFYIMDFFIKNRETEKTSLRWARFLDCCLIDELGRINHDDNEISSYIDKALFKSV